MMGFGLILTILVVVLFIYLLNDRGQGKSNLFTTSSAADKSAMDLAKERYARGEITKEEFDRLRRDLVS